MSQSTLIDETMLKVMQDRKKIINKIEKNIKKYDKILGNSIEEIINKKKIMEAIKKDIDIIESNQILSKLIQYYSNENQILTEELNERERKFGKELHDNLQKCGLKLEGMMPKYKALWYTLEIDLDRNSCKIYFGPKEELLTTIKLNPEKISDYLNNHKNKLETSDINTKILIDTYDNIVNNQRGEYKKRVPIIKLLFYYAVNIQNDKFYMNPVDKNYNSYNRVQFSYHLYKCRRDRKIRARLTAANRSQVRNKREYLWIPTSETEGSVFSYIEIMEAE